MGIVPDGNEQDEDGFPRCICMKYGREDEQTDCGFMVQCDMCNTWQHGACMRLKMSDVGRHFCEECRPDLWSEVLRDWASRYPKSVQEGKPSTTVEEKKQLTHIEGVLRTLCLELGEAGR